MKRLAFAIFGAAALVACITPAPEPAPPPNYSPSPPPADSPPQADPPQADPPPQTPKPPPIDNANPDLTSSQERVACGSRGQRCASGSYCRFAAAGSCGEGAASGTCEPIPQICNRMFAPVCGCDGKTHSNSCTAAAQGVNIRSNGACESKATQVSCGGIADKRCPSGSTCADDPKDTCDPQKGGRDCMGICEANEAKCAPVRCKMYCKQGWQVGPDGCEICACAQ